MIRQIPAQALHRHLLSRDLPVIDQQPANASVCSSIGSGVTDFDLAPVRQPQYSGSLNVEKKKLDGILNPGDLIPFSPQRSQLIDLAPRVVRHEVFALHAANHFVSSAARIPRY